MMLLFSREKVALDESGTTKQQNQFVQIQNHVVNDKHNEICGNEIFDGEMMATPKTAAGGGRRTSRKLKREKITVANQVPTTVVENSPNTETSTESKPEKRPERRGELAVLTQKSEVNIPEIVRKLQQAANAKKLHEVTPPQYVCTVPPNACGIGGVAIRPNIVHSVITHTPPPTHPPPQPTYRHPAVIQPPIIAPVQVHTKLIPAYVQHHHNVHTNRSEWSTTPIPTSSSVSTYNNQKHKKFMKKNKSAPNIR